MSYQKEMPNGQSILIEGPISVVTVDDKNYEIVDDFARNSVENIQQGNFDSSMLLALVKILHPVGSTFITDRNVRPFSDIDPLGDMQWSLVAQGRALVGVNPSSGDTNLNAPNKPFGRSDSVIVSHDHAAKSVTSGVPSNNSTGNGGGHSHGTGDSGHPNFPTYKGTGSTENVGALPNGKWEMWQINEGGQWSHRTATSTAAAHAHTLNNHTHTISCSVGAANGGVSGANQNYQPSYTMYIWKRTS